jgi:hypothetical protein
MEYYSTLKVYTGYDIDEGKMKREQYKIKNAKGVIDMNLRSGDTLLIDGIGRLEIYQVVTQIETVGKNPYRHLEIVAGKVTV